MRTGWAEAHPRFIGVLMRFHGEGAEVVVSGTGRESYRGEHGYDAEFNDRIVSLSEFLAGVEGLPVADRGVRVASPNTPEKTLIVADGFSCREQIEQATGRRTFHTAEVISRTLSRKV